MLTKGRQQYCHSIRNQYPDISLNQQMGCCADKPKLSMKNIPEPTQRSKDSNESEIHLRAHALYCSQSHEIAQICISKDCKADALSCSRPDCPNCAKLHPGCRHVPLADVTSMVQRRSSQHRDLTKKMHELEVKLLNELVARRKATFKRVFDKGFSQRYGSIIDALYFKESDIIIQGKEAYEFCEKLRLSCQELPKLQQQLLGRYEKEVSRQVESISRIQDSVIDQYASRCKIDVKESPRLPHSEKSVRSDSIKPFDIKTALDLDTKILSRHQIATMAFISGALNNPQKIELIFRASQHGFKAAKFHETCDGITDTFTLIQTQFEKVIGGYTPLRWNETQGFAKDESGASFLLSLTLKQKMSLVRPQKAIQCIPSYGPVFGGGADIAVSDDCHLNRTSCTNFSYSYNYRDEYEYNQQAWEALCGVPTGKYFKVKEYEVYKVTW